MIDTRSRGRRLAEWIVAGLVLALLLGGMAPLSGASSASAAVPDPRRPFGSHLVNLPSGSATAPGGRTAADADVRAAYDAWKKRYLKAGTPTVCGTDTYYVDASSATGSMVVSEGQGYGMVITALMAGHDANARAQFDGLYRYVLDHPSEVNPELMAWHQGADCASFPGDAGSATDGDLDVAYGLLLADTQWGSSTPGSFDYRAEAVSLIAAIGASEINPTTRLPKLGDWPESGTPFWFATRSSDLMIDHFVAFQNATGDALWGQVATAAAALVTTMQGQATATGLLPDFIVNTNATPNPAPANFLESANDGNFSYNANRVPWRLASAALLTGNAAARTASVKIADWVQTSTGSDPTNIRAGYTLTGTQLVNYGDIAFSAPMAAAAAVPTATGADQSWIEKIWSSVKTTVTGAASAGYYSDTIGLQVMLLLSGNFWLPDTNAATGAGGVVPIGGADRYAVSAGVSAQTFVPDRETVYIASGEVFPDALSASAAAGTVGSPVLLVARDSIPAVIDVELRRLDPLNIVLLGGANTISAGVEAALAGYIDPGGSVQRVGGADRYAVSAALSVKTFPGGAAVAYVASGQVFPDALAGAAAAGGQKAPVLLVSKDSVPDSVAAELDRLNPSRVVLLGGTATVSDSTKNSIASAAGVSTVQRIAGADRFAVAAAISTATFPAAATRTVYVASGAVFPDALSASAAAAKEHAPVLLVTRDSVPASIVAEMQRLRPTRLVVLGGLNTVSPEVVAQLGALIYG
ncbi:glycosyl hydrolase family 8 [Herbiconiux daphne]|uniref:Glycosyl hydrolase family 8 n=1 Tax=Herbiconiux daphne TaxID=2970914 RepID=A0ABT2GXK8_9MICO|nr:glycosyl hydrolase family 8 [Herbiconiux daphne]MCS5732694.1 glycosyl hydrolase family 8 [Herbiconiux daphne]